MPGAIFILGGAIPRAKPKILSLFPFDGWGGSCILFWGALQPPNLKYNNLLENTPNHMQNPEIFFFTQPLLQRRIHVCKTKFNLINNQISLPSNKLIMKFLSDS